MSRGSVDGDGIFAGLGCLALVLWVSWFGFLVWVIYKLVTWLTAQEL